jgi:hypothetical protein
MKTFLFKIPASAVAALVDAAAAVVVVVTLLRNKRERDKCNSSYLALTNYHDDMMFFL